MQHIRVRTLIAVLIAVAAVQAGGVRKTRVGEVAGNDVYVRSGASLNHYTITRLNAGDRVQIVGETGNWYEILPPPGTFSLISGDYVDVAADGRSVVNGNRVRVRAGSLLNDNKYTVQAYLSKGHEVRVIQKQPDGFLRIEPPGDVTLWISREYVHIVPDQRVRAARNTNVQAGAGPPSDTTVTDPAEHDGGGARSAPGPSDDEKPNGASASADESREKDRLLSRWPETPQREQLAAIDELARRELAKPILDRRFAPLIERLAAIAAQDEDEFAQRYADRRMQQLSEMGELVSVVRKMRLLSERSESIRRTSMEDRARIRVLPPPEPSSVDVEGELRVSALYPEGALPCRYRLVDTTDDLGHTVAYVEVPPEMSEDARRFLGRRVGVRASSQRWLAGGVNPVRIYVAREFVGLGDRDQGPATATRASMP